MDELHRYHFRSILMLSLFVLCLVSPAISTATRRFHFNVQWKEVTRLCYTKKLLTVNGRYPGPTITVNEGDTLEIKVNNLIEKNTTLHWHGIRQRRTGWADGPAYVTQCPIGPGKTYTYKFNVEDHRGTLWWHAHVFWQRASVNGALIIYPRMPYPFKVPIQQEIPIILGEWWNSDTDSIEKDMIMSGGGPQISDAYTMNGLPGPSYTSSSCSKKDTLIQPVSGGKTYMLRIINAGLNAELFFAISNHTLTVVEVDALYTKPFKTPYIMITPGQTATVLVTADQKPDSSGLFPFGANPYITALGFPYDNSTTIGFLHYYSKATKKVKERNLPRNPTIKNLPGNEDTQLAIQFLVRLRSLGSVDYPCYVPHTVDKRVITTIGFQLQDCPQNKTCAGIAGKRFLTSMNNQSFVRPSRSLLQSYYENITTKVYSTDFPEKPPNTFNYAGVDPFATNMNTEFGTKVLSVPYGTNLEIVFQNTNFIHMENHPMHVHGHNFYIVGSGLGNYNPEKDQIMYNLVDPPEMNTVAVLSGGWAAIRFKADNPGVWFIHCHLEEHASWGLSTALIVENGPNPSRFLLLPMIFLLVDLYITFEVST